jgi:hypothetical protein
LWSEWSDSWRFQIASQSEWRYNRGLGNADNKLQIGEDLVGDIITPTYDLSGLFASQSSTNWYLGFTATMTTTNITYVFYLDLDHVNNSGATFPPERPYGVTTIPAHQPEFAIYVDDTGNGINAYDTWVYAWNGSSWNPGNMLGVIRGAVFTSIYTPTQYVELEIPNTAIGMEETTGSASVILLSVNNSTHELEDSVPSDPAVPGDSPQISRFSAVSDHINLISPPNTPIGDPTTYPSLLPFAWDWPTGSTPSTPFAGSRLEVYRDADYSFFVDDIPIDSSSAYIGMNNTSFLNDLIGNNTYYWRIRPRYKLPSHIAAYGAWTSGWSFRRLGFTAQNLQTSVSWVTPTFNWDMVEGASSYKLQVSTDPNFGSSAFNPVTTKMTSYTLSGTLKPGNYYWRVQVNRYGGIVNDWSEVETFSLSLPAPTGLNPDNNMIIHTTPTLCWDPLIKYNVEAPYEPILTAWKYHVEVSRDENFSDSYSVTTANNCWTPVDGYQDGTYWWHVAMIDGNGRMGSYSYTATYTKQYPITTLISPIDGSVPSTPTFIWTPVDGAATYRLEVSLVETFSPLYDTIVTINTQFTPTKIYKNNTEYFWRVAIRDHDGNQGPFIDAIILIGVGNKTFLPLMRK